MPKGQQIENMAAKYSFPYHHLVEDSNGTWLTSRHLSWAFRYMGYLTAVVNEVKERSPEKLIEIGCGDGRLIGELAKAGFPEINGIDIDERAVLFARAFNYGNQAQIESGDIRELDANGFDCAVAMEVIEHIPDSTLPSVIKAVWERTRARAGFVVTVPTDNLPVTPSHFRHYNRALLEQHLSPYFRIVKTRYLHRPGRRETLLNKLAMNRLFTLNERHVLRLIAHIYRSRLLNADASNGAHLLAVAERIDEPQTDPTE